MYEYVPGLLNVCWYVPPFGVLALANFSGPSVTSTLWPPSLKCHVTASPWLMLTALGPNESFSTATSAGIAHAGVAARARAAAIPVERTAGTEARGRTGVSPPAGTRRRGSPAPVPGAGVRPPLRIRPCLSRGG